MKVTSFEIYRFNNKDKYSFLVIYCRSSICKSLINLSNSVAVMVFEVLRQQNYPNLLFEEPFKGADYLEK